MTNRLVRFLAIGVFAIASIALVPARAAAATSCSVATSAAAHVLCWLDFTGYSGTGTQTFTINLPDGSVLTGTITNTGTVTLNPTAIPVYGTGNFGGVALGGEDYLGVAGKPAFYNSGTIGPITLSNLRLTDAQGQVISTTRISAADAESTDGGDGVLGNIAWTTTGTAWAQLQLMPNPSGSIASVCTLTGVGTIAARCVPNGNVAPAAAYILTTNLTNAQTISMSATTTSAQGFAFAVQLSALTVAKNVASRVASGDQFTVQITRAGTTIASASTTGTGTSASATSAVVPGDTYVLKDVAASSSTANIANYASTVACANAVTSSTTLPASGASTQSVTIVPAIDDQITCTFTNNALTITDVAATPTKTVLAGASSTDSFTLKNTSGVAGTFTIATASVVAGSTSVTPSGYTFNGTTYTSLTALQTAITAAGPTAAGGSLTIGIVYTVPATLGTSATATLAATLASGTGVSPQATATEADTITPAIALSIVKTGTTAANPGGLIAYNVVVTDNGPSSASGTSFNDPLPTGVTLVGTPTCGVPTGGAVCGPVTVPSANVVASTITTLPVGASVTFAIAATAAAAGTYTNTASAAPAAGTSGSTVTSSVTTTVAASNGLLKTVQNVTSGTAAGTADTAVPGDRLRYVLTFTNTTGVSISTLSFTDVVPANTGFSVASCPSTGGSSLPSGVTCTVTAPAAGSSGTSVIFQFGGAVASGATVSASFDVLVQ